MKIKDFLRERHISLGDNVKFLLEALELKDPELLKKLEDLYGESAKMSKSKANTVDPQEMIERFGADTVRLYVLFAAPPDQDFEWTQEGIQGAYRFLNRLWHFVISKKEMLKGVSYTKDELSRATGRAKEIRHSIHSAVEGYLRDMEKNFQFNTAIAKVMKLLGDLQEFEPKTEIERKVLKEGVDTLLLLLAPVCPHLCDELWERLGNEGLATTSPFPEPDPQALKKEEIEIPVQINGKVKTRVIIPADADEEKVKEIVMAQEKVKSLIEGKEIRRFIYVKGKLVNLVVK